MGVRPVTSDHPISQNYGSNATGNLPWDHPLIQQFGNYQPNGHTGIDFSCPVGTPVFAPDDGVVMWADWGTKLPGDNSHEGWASRYYLDKNASGIPVVIEHKAQGGYASLMSHLNGTKLNPFDKVEKGQLLGYTAKGVVGETGNTGLSTGPHLHFEVIPTTYPWTNGMYGRVDPTPYIREDVRTFEKAEPLPTPQTASKLKYNKLMTSIAFTPPADCLRVFGFARPAMPVSDVLHHWDDPARKPTRKGTTTYLGNQPRNGVSAHYVGEAGAVDQMVDERNASHANGHGAANAMTVTHEWNPRCSAEDREALAEHLATCWVNRGRTTPGIVEMHKTYKATACPGRYEQHLPEIRARAAELFAAKKRGGVVVQTARKVKAVVAPAKRPASKPSTSVHRVQPGETLGGIARHYGTTVPALVASNQYITNPSYLNVGDRLTIPASSLVLHDVRPGETLELIARRYGTTKGALLSANKFITNPNYLAVGDRLTIR